MSGHRLPLLTGAQRQQFTRFPRLDERLLAQHYLLNEEDLKQVKGRRRDFNRLVAFHRSGEIRDRSPEAQSNRASGVNLLVAVITAWNTVYLERVVTALRAEGHEVSDELLAHVSPLGWEHSGLTGDDQWRPDEVPEPGTYRKLNA